MPDNSYFKNKRRRLLKYLLLGNYSLLAFNIILIFVIPLFPASWHDILYDIFLTLIFITVGLSIDKYKSHYLITATTLILIIWISHPSFLPLLDVISRVMSILFFIMVVANFVYMIYKSENVNSRIILESINGYLLLGIMFALIMALAMYFNPAAYHFPEDMVNYGENIRNMSNYLYYTLVTMSTVGYGDVLPATPFSRSLATLMSVSGQMYIAIIIALLIGKFASKQK